MLKAAEIDDGRRLSNTSYRKHLASRLNEGYVPKEVGRHVTGHKQASSLDNYAPMSHRQQRVLSDIVSGQNINFNNPTTAYSTDHSSCISVAPVSTAAQVETRSDNIPIPVVPHTRPVPPAAVGRPMASVPQTPPVLTPSHSEITHDLPNFLQGALIHGPVNVSITINQEKQDAPPVKRRRINVIYSDSD
jgi:hypothetical protein